MLSKTSLYYFLLIISLLMHPVAHASMGEVEFKKYVLSFLTENYKSYKFEDTNDKYVIKMGETELGLLNIYNRYKELQLDDQELDDMLKDHFTTLFATLKDRHGETKISWEQVRDNIRPQIAPIEYLDRIPLVYEALDDHSVIGFVLDEEKAFRYIIEKDLAQLGVTKSTLKEVALKNLEKQSKHIKMQGALGENKFLAIQELDGYDAARILLPDLRRFIASKLGFPFYAAIPNRDFLIMWSDDSTIKFKDFTKQKVRSDFERQPYPVSPNIFIVDKDSIKVFNN